LRKRNTDTSVTWFPNRIMPEVHSYKSNLCPVITLMTFEEHSHVKQQSSRIADQIQIAVCHAGSSRAGPPIG
jgi:hypothetical protein